jgi:putative ABC transport system substrate-binding protein
MDRRTLLAGMAALVNWPIAAEAQQSQRVYRIGLLSGGTDHTAEANPLWRALLEGLRDLGYIQGQNLIVDLRSSEGLHDRLAALASALVRERVDVIVAAATQPVHAAQRATSTIPIVMPNHSDPVGSGIVGSLDRPGGNITGLSILNPDLTGKRLELLGQAVPGLVRVAVLWNPTHEAYPQMLREADAAAKALGLQLYRRPAKGLEDYDAAFAGMTKDRAEALLVLGDVTFWLHRARIADLATKARLPAVFAQREHVEVGGLMSYGADLRDNFRRAATYVAKILKGAKPGDLPIEQPTKFDFVINLRTAKALGLTIPPSLLLRADQVIE